MKKIYLFLILVFVLNLGFVCAEENLSAEQKAINCLNQSKEILIEMQDQGFSVQRVNDSLRQLEDLFNAQVVLEEKGKKDKKEKNKTYDFSIVFPYCEEIIKIKESAFNSRDKLLALKKFYNETIEPGINTSGVDSIILEIENEIKNEKYERIDELIEKGYNQIINLKSSHTTLNLFYEVTTQNLKKIVYRNRYFILSLLGILILLFFIYKKAIHKWIIQGKIKKLELRKKILKDMIMDTQNSYFNKGIISEGTFNIKINKLAELIRDMDRQIPLLKEELAKISWRKSSKNE